MKITVELTVKEMYDFLPKNLQELCDQLCQNLTETASLDLEEAQKIFVPQIFSTYYRKLKEGEKEKASQEPEVK